MQVSVESTGTLERRINVEVPAEQVENAVENKLRQLARTAKIKGFRPGKVPMRIVRQQYGEQVRQEVLGDLIQSTYGEALQKEELNPAGQPRIEPQTLEPGKPFSYTAVIEVFPEIKLADPGKIEVTRPEAEITDADMDKLLDRIRKQHAEWRDVERKATDGDRLVVDFEGRIDGEAFEGGKAEKANIELGAGQMLEDFEKGLKGARAGEDLKFKVKFPKDYNAEHLAGKKAEFTAHVHSVSEPELPELDDDFASKLGINEGGMSKLREQLRESMEREARQASRQRLKKQVMDGLYEYNPVEVPGALVDDEIARLRQDMLQRMGLQQGSDQAPELPRELFEEEASRRVALGLLVGAVIREHELKLEEQRVKDTVSELVAGTENPQEMARAYLGDANARRSIEAMAMEEQVVDYLLDKVKVKSSKVDFEELVGQQQG